MQRYQVPKKQEVRYQEFCNPGRFGVHGNVQGRLRRFRGSWLPFPLCHRLRRGMRLPLPRHQRFCKQELCQQDRWSFKTINPWKGELRDMFVVAYRLPTMLPWALPTATSSPTTRNLTFSALPGWRAANCSFARPKLRTSPV